MTADDLDLFDEAISANTRSTVARCSVGALLRRLPDDMRERVIQRLAGDPEVIQHAALANAIRQVLGADVKASAVSRHRRRLCTCTEDLR
jgi:hypothetical protein